MKQTVSSIKKYGQLKAEILVEGINYSDDFLVEFSKKNDLLEKRRAYGNSDEKMFPKEMKVPQEILLPEGIVVAVNQRNNAKWSLECVNDNFYVTNGEELIPIEFPQRPNFYDLKMMDGSNVSRVVTLYGNATLGVFSPGTCYFWAKGEECKFCSLQPTRKSQADHEMFIKPATAKEAIKIALESEGERVNHFLLNGGTISNYDLGFKRHIEVLEAVSELDIPSHVEKHLISMPPKDLSLFERLSKTGATIAMDLEIYDKNLFEEICPGKSKDYGRENFLGALKEAVKYLGRGNVYCGFVGGLEPVESLAEGMHRLGELGVVPAINIFHNDPGSQFANRQRPKLDEVKEIGYHMSVVYDKYNFKPFIKNTGRNSLDTEAYLKCFL
ncbi:radical SAM protein [Pontibacillus litoralis]|uniref:Biotin synthase n=1 Tax=Pontibacillus litoralis JSM 072002 TaxID=1385512 RepID=A0A0A5FZJ3_9BACI|nr:radical SAM protein [Pontibacillus litoralis]KGX85214.1 biotin synthase [Pontibacillus litoralis JSM 072002]